MTAHVQDKYIAFGLIILLGIGILLAVSNFLGAFVGALVLFTLFNPIYQKLSATKGMTKPFSAILTILISFVIVIIPTILIGSLAIEELISLGNQRLAFEGVIENTILTIEEQFPQVNIQEQMNTLFDSAISYTQSLLAPLLQQITDFVLNTIIMYFLLYFMFIECSTWKQKLYEFIPFSRKNSKKLVDEFAKITNSTVVSTGVIAIIQGFLIGISFWITGIQSPVLWGVIGTILSFLPIIGTPVLWIPASLYLLFTGQYVAGIGLLTFSAIITSNIDSILRPFINRSIANIHPLTTFLGVFFGLYLFGILGIILGPLLISYFFQTVEMYKEEYA